MKKKGLIIKTNNEVCEITPKNGTDFKAEELHEFVGGYIEILNLLNGYILVVNEEGRLIGLPINTIASDLTKSLIVGDVVLCPKDMVK